MRGRTCVLLRVYVRSYVCTCVCIQFGDYFIDVYGIKGKSSHEMLNGFRTVITLMLIVPTEMFLRKQNYFVKHGPTILYKFGHTR